MHKKKNIFIYAVCGDSIHIETLNISLKYLIRFSKNEILVITDTSRNKAEIIHDNIVEIDSSGNFVQTLGQGLDTLQQILVIPSF